MRTQFPWRTCLVALVLFGVGLTFLLLGVLHFGDKDRGLFVAFICIGSLCFLPGGYLMYNLVQTVRGVAGFDASQCELQCWLVSCFCVGKKDAGDTDDLRLFLTVFMFRCALG